MACGRRRPRPADICGDASPASWRCRPRDAVPLAMALGAELGEVDDGVRISARSTQGVKLMDLEGDDRLVSVARLSEREDVVVGEETNAESEPVN